MIFLENLKGVLCHKTFKGVWYLIGGGMIALARV